MAEVKKDGDRQVKWDRFKTSTTGTILTREYIKKAMNSNITEY